MAGAKTVTRGSGGAPRERMLAEARPQASAAPAPCGRARLQGSLQCQPAFPSIPCGLFLGWVSRQWELRGCLLGPLGKTWPSEKRERRKGNILSLYPSNIYRRGAQSRGSCPWQYAEDGGEMEAEFFTANPQTSGPATCVVKGQTIKSFWATHSLYCYSSFLFLASLLGFVLVIKWCLTLCNTMDYSPPGPSVLHYLLSLLKFTSTELMMLSNRLIFCHSHLILLSILLSIRVFSNESPLHIRWPKY